MIGQHIFQMPGRIFLKIWSECRQYNCDDQHEYVCESGTGKAGCKRM